MTEFLIGAATFLLLALGAAVRFAIGKGREASKLKAQRDAAEQRASDWEAVAKTPPVDVSDVIDRLKKGDG